MNIRFASFFKIDKLCALLRRFELKLYSAAVGKPDVADEEPARFARKAAARLPRSLFLTHGFRSGQDLMHEFARPDQQYMQNGSYLFPELICKR